MLTFTKKVLDAWKHWGYEQLFIEGPQGLGKTTYSMLVAYEVYRDWKTVLYYTVFDIDSIEHEIDKRIELLEAGELETTDRIPVVIFDDAGLYFSKYMYVINPAKAQYINALFNMARSIFATTIFTSPDMDILKELRKKSWWVGEPTLVTNKSDPRRVMKLYKRRITSKGAYISKSAYDQFKTNIIPDWVWKEYNKKRGKALRQIMSVLKELKEKKVATPPLGGHV